ncbi:MAG: ribonuclease P protein component [Ornithinimicrobium sp.]
MLPQRHRLRTSGDFTAVLSRGARGVRRAGTPRLVVHCSGVPHVSQNATESDDPVPVSVPPRVGFIVSKAVGNSVVRHRVTRRLRAVMAARLAFLPPGTDVVIRALPRAAVASSVVLAADVDRALRRVL